MEEHIRAMSDWRQHIRSRPGFYIGSEQWNGDSLHRLIEALIDLAINPKFLNQCTKIQIKLLDDGSISLQDNGRGLPPYPWEFGQHEKKPALELIVTMPISTNPAQGYYERYGFLNYLGAVLGNLSSQLEIETVYEKEAYMLACSRGKLVKPLQKITRTFDTGTLIRFSPDTEVFTDITLDGQRLLKYLVDRAFQYIDVEFTLSNKGKLHRLNIS